MPPPSTRSHGGLGPRPGTSLAGWQKQASSEFPAQAVSIERPDKNAASGLQETDSETSNDTVGTAGMVTAGADKQTGWDVSTLKNSDLETAASTAGSTYSARIISAHLCTLAYMT